MKFLITAGHFLSSTLGAQSKTMKMTTQALNKPIASSKTSGLMIVVVLPSLPEVFLL